MRVIIIGGGIGGLALAHRLHGAGVETAVYERDEHPADKLQGYRIHIDPHGAAALHECLPAELFAAVVASGGRGGDEFGFVTEQLAELLHLDAATLTGGPHAPEHSHYGVGRVALRRILLSGLADVVHTGRTFERYDHTGGQVTAHFADGTSATGDVLVGADGGRSRVRVQYLPHAQVVETGVVTIVGKLPLAGGDREWAAPFRSGPRVVMPARGGSVFVAPHEFEAGPFQDDTPPYVMWGLAARRESYRTRPESLDGAGLRDLALEMATGWHPDLRRLVADSDPASIIPISIRTSVPVPAWEPSTVTLLGDAIHSMTPFRGIGANTALRDAVRLGRELVAVDRGERPLLDAVGAYEHDMREYGFAAVRTSLAAARQSVAGGRGARIMTRAVFRTANAVPALKRRMFAGFGEAPDRSSGRGDRRPTLRP